MATTSPRPSCSRSTGGTEHLLLKGLANPTSNSHWPLVGHMSIPEPSTVTLSLPGMNATLELVGGISLTQAI